MGALRDLAKNLRDDCRWLFHCKLRGHEPREDDLRSLPDEGGRIMSVCVRCNASIILWVDPDDLDYYCVREHI